jgi:antitoxin component YwqK of YwqJK toxin-antitoxin module
MVLNILFIVVLVLFIIAIVKIFNRNSKLNDVEISRKKFENNNDSDWKTDLLYESGEIRRQFKFRDERTQLYRSFFKNGNIEATWNYIDGIQSGEETEFDENGNIKAKRNYSQGKQDGESYKIMYS